jgi:hypothetical protein
MQQRERIQALLRVKAVIDRLKAIEQTTFTQREREVWHLSRRARALLRLIRV